MLPGIPDPPPLDRKSTSMASQKNDKAYCSGHIEKNRNGAAQEAARTYRSLARPDRPTADASRMFPDRIAAACMGTRHAATAFGEPPSSMAAK